MAIQISKRKPRQKRRGFFISETKIPRNFPEEPGKFSRNFLEPFLRFLIYGYTIIPDRFLPTERMADFYSEFSYIHTTKIRRLHQPAGQQVRTSSPSWCNGIFCKFV